MYPCIILYIRITTPCYDANSAGLADRCLGAEVALAAKKIGSSAGKASPKGPCRYNVGPSNFGVSGRRPLIERRAHVHLNLEATSPSVNMIEPRLWQALPELHSQSLVCRIVETLP